jgi:hypothetical protein
MWLCLYLKQVRLALLALVTLGDVMLIEMILCVAPPKVAKASRE